MLYTVTSRKTSGVGEMNKDYIKVKEENPRLTNGENEIKMGMR